MRCGSIWRGLRAGRRLGGPSAAKAPPARRRGGGAAAKPGATSSSRARKRRPAIICRSSSTMPCRASPKWCGAGPVLVDQVHRLLQELLGLPRPVYRHHPAGRDAAGRKLSKSTEATGLRELGRRGQRRRISAARMQLPSSTGIAIATRPRDSRAPCHGMLARSGRGIWQRMAPAQQRCPKSAGEERAQEALPRQRRQEPKAARKRVAKSGPAWSRRRWRRSRMRFARLDRHSRH